MESLDNTDFDQLLSLVQDKIDYVVSRLCTLEYGRDDSSLQEELASLEALEKKIRVSRHMSANHIVK